ncbi:hypothetical protein F5Y03DRAFT_350259 [Xylaria venustula]|nr:hypothetical protein F5Y03DRAFT_350259 [Xylaria venustula]
MASADEPPLGPRLRDAPVQQPREPRPHPPMTPPELDHHKDFLHGIEEVAKDLDQLVNRLNRRPILQESLRWHFLDREQANGEEPDKREGEGERGREQDRNTEEEHKRFQYDQPTGPWSHVPVSLQPSEPTPALDPIPELAMPCDPCLSTIPPLYDTLQPPGPIHFDSLAADTPSDDKFLDRTLPRTNDYKRPRRPTDVRLHKSASNLRKLGLVTDMIENGVQCNVQNSTPPSPAITSSALALAALPASKRCIEAQDAIDSHLLPGPMQLEIDMGFSELDEDTLLNDNLALRHASTPAGIRKFGFLRYRSSSEAAQSCKNMKKSVPRMRRRHRTNPNSTSGSSVPQSPSTAA